MVIKRLENEIIYKHNKSFLDQIIKKDCISGVAPPDFYAQLFLGLGFKVCVFH